MSDIRSIAREIVACLQFIEELRGETVPETFLNPFIKEKVENGITIPIRLLRRLEAAIREDGWPTGATVKIKYVGFQADPNSRDFGWARRNADGLLVTVHGGDPLDQDSWVVVEERGE